MYFERTFNTYEEALQRQKLIMSKYHLDRSLVSGFAIYPIGIEEYDTFYTLDCDICDCDYCKKYNDKPY